MGKEGVEKELAKILNGSNWYKFLTCFDDFSDKVEHLLSGIEMNMNKIKIHGIKDPS